MGLVVLLRWDHFLGMEGDWMPLLIVLLQLSEDAHKGIF